MQPVPEHASKERPEAHQRQTGTTPTGARPGGLTVSLWLLAALIAEAELLLWVLERTYSG